MKSTLSIISFTDHAVGVVLKKSLPYPWSSRFSLLEALVLHFTFMPVTHFELIFVTFVRSVSRFNFLHMDVQLFEHHLVKRLPLLHCIVFAPKDMNQRNQKSIL